MLLKIKHHFQAISVAQSSLVFFSILYNKDILKFLLYTYSHVFFTLKIVALIKVANLIQSLSLKGFLSYFQYVLIHMFDKCSTLLLDHS
jgi:hypothetical protein